MTDRPQAGRLLRAVGFSFGIAVCVGTIIGGGILRVPGAVAERAQEPWLILLLWLLGGVHALLGATVVAELTMSVPQAGGLYVPARRAFGDFAGLLVGWTDWLVNCAGVAALSLAFADFGALLVPAIAAYNAVTAIALLIAVFGVNWMGVRQGSDFQKFASLVKCLLLVTLIVILFVLVPAHPPDIARNTGAAHGVATIATAYLLVYGVFAGWAAPIQFIEEYKTVAGVPRAMTLSIVLATVIYVLLNAGLLRALPLNVLASSELPAATAIAQVFGPSSAAIVGAIALAIVASAMNGGVMILPRILYGLGRDRLFVHTARRVNRGGTPDVALGLSAISAILLAATGTFETVFLLLAALIVFAMLVAEAALFALRIKEPRLPRPFRAIGYPVLPALLMAVDTVLLVLVIAARPASGAWMLALIAFCFLLSLQARRHH